MQDLAGNAMALPVLMALLQCTFTAVSWRQAAAKPTLASAQALRHLAVSCHLRKPILTMRSLARVIVT